LLEKFKEKGEYLEIGVAHGYTLEAVNFPNKWGVDPFPKCKWDHIKGISISPIPSDEFFSQISEEKEFVGIFLDGAHTFKQSFNDLVNSLNHLSSDGFILFDDSVPEDEYSALNSISQCHELRKLNNIHRETWSGDVFKTIIAASENYPELEIITMISPQHPQTLIYWKNGVKSKIQPLSQEAMEKYDRLKYDDIFSNLLTADKYFHFDFELKTLRKFAKL
jgi:hypothetical protein